MEIIYLGHSCFLLKNREVKVVLDPFADSVGFKQAKIAADIVTISHDHKDHNDLSLVTGELASTSLSLGGPMVINGPGEYEIKQVSITGISSFHDKNKGKDRGKNTMYVVDIDDIRVAHLGDLGHKLDDKQLEELDGVDVLLVPVGGEFTIDSKEAQEVIGQVGASIVIPMHYKTSQHSKAFGKLAPVEDFVKVIGKEVKKEDKLKLKKLDLPEEMEVYILNKYGR